MNEQFRCEHPESQIRWRRQSNGVRQAWRQCLTCFQVVGTAVKHVEVPSDAPGFDEDARDDHWQQLSEAHSKYWQEQQRQREAEFQARRDHRREEYRDYLTTITWARKREAVLSRDDYVCQAQMVGCTDRASQAHHLTYDRIFDEPLFDLVAVCRNCHERLHANQEG